MKVRLLGAALCIAALAVGAAWAEDPPAAAPAAPADSASVITKPDWAALPSARDLQRYFPKYAADINMEGRATVECTVKADGRLTGCVAVSEAPIGFGFGQATVDAANEVFRMKPTTKDGAPVDGGTVRIPMRWTLSDGKTPGGTKYYQLMAWSAAPSRADVAAVSPGEGTAYLDCVVHSLELGECQVSNATAPAFGEAALKLAPKFRAVAAPELGSRVIVPFRFSAKPDSQIRQKLSFAATPDKAALLAAFPPAARTAGLAEGEGRLACVLAADGALTQCRVVGESPTEVGFGAAALALAAQFRINPWTTDGQAVDGLPLQIPLRFRAESPTEAKAAP